MRTIDADGLKIAIRQELDAAKQTGDEADICISKMIEEAFFDIIDNTPTIEPERKKGKWIKISPAGIYECSECGKNVMTDDIDAYKWCHGCGCKMEVEK